MAFVTIVKAIIARVLFAVHAFIAVWKLVDLKGGKMGYWFMVSPLMFQGFEGIVSICARNGEEMKWFCPSVFLYLVSVVPPIWLMELGLHDLRVNSNRAEQLSELGGFKLDLAIPIEQWVRVLEQVLLVMLLIGRWLLPKGMLTREQLSQLLLAYMAMAADIIELFECFKEDTVTRNIELIYAVLGIWSWSLLQFTLVLSATHAPKPRPSINYPPPEPLLLMEEDRASNTGDGAPKSPRNINLYLNMDIIAILTTVFMQDGPFFILRMTLIFHYKVVSYLNIFFTCKNTLVVSLQLYRLFVLCSKRRHLFSERTLKFLPCLGPPIPRKSSKELSSSSTESLESGSSKNPPKEEPMKDEQDADRDADGSLIQLIEQIGEENILKELETLIKAAAEDETLEDQMEEAEEIKDIEIGEQAVDFRPNCNIPISEDYQYPVQALVHRPPEAPFQRDNRRCEEDEYSRPDSGFQNYSSMDAVNQNPIKRFSNASKRSRDFAKLSRGYASIDNGSEFASASDQEEPNLFIRSELQGASGSSTSLIDRPADVRQQGWKIIRDRYLPHSWKGSSVPSSLHQVPVPWNKGMVPKMAQVVASHRYFSPEPQRRFRQDKRTSSMRTKGLAADLVRQRFMDEAEHNHLKRTHSVGIMQNALNNVSCISESDADTLETVV